jgi:hypothetical protein
VRPEDIWQIEERYLAAYGEYCERGLQAARRSKLAVVAIARTAMPHLANTLPLIDELVGHFGSRAVFFYENDSTDDTGGVLDRWAGEWAWCEVRRETLGGPDTRGFEPDRTVRLARCRTICQEWVAANARDADYTLVLDIDPHGGFSPQGILNSVGWLLESGPTAGGMASNSMFVHKNENGDILVAQYDAWAMRMNWWEDRRSAPGGMRWAHLLMPPVGSPPFPINSAFGGACLYRTAAFLAGRYGGIGVDGQPDCEHVALHRTMREHGYQLHLNPSSRYVAILPEAAE